MHSSRGDDNYVSDKVRKDGIITADWWTLFFSGGVFIVATIQAVIFAVQAGFFWWQLRLIRSGADDTKVAAEAARDATQAAKDTLKSNRAWICPAGFEAIEFEDSFINNVHVNVGLRFGQKLENVGRSPALNANVITKFSLIGVSDDVPKFVPDNNLLKKEEAIIGQNRPISAANKGLSDTEYAMFKSRTHRLIVYTKCTYLDMFDSTVSRQTETCLEIIYDGNVVNKNTGRTIPRFYGTYVGNQNTAS